MTRCREESPELYHVNGTLVRCFLHADESEVGQ
jgi:hypothetical protein